MSCTNGTCDLDLRRQLFRCQPWWWLQNPRVTGNSLVLTVSSVWNKHPTSGILSQPAHPKSALPYWGACPKPKAFQGKKGLPYVYVSLVILFPETSEILWLSVDGWILWWAGDLNVAFDLLPTPYDLSPINMAQFHRHRLLFWCSPAISKWLPSIKIHSRR